MDNFGWLMMFAFSGIAWIIGGIWLIKKYGLRYKKPPKVKKKRNNYATKPE